MTAFLHNKWPRRIELSFGEAIMFSGPNMMSHIPPTSGSILEDWGTIQVKINKTVLCVCQIFKF